LRDRTLSEGRRLLRTSLKARCILSDNACSGFYEGECMRIIFLAPLLLGLQVLTAPIVAGTIKEADYPVQYEVVSASKAGEPAVGKSCSMTLRDQAQTKVVVNVWKKGLGACQVPDSGKVYRGRVNQKKNEIELVIPVGTDKARVEEWQIIGTVDINPS
jgi:hypothetical protein